MRTKDEIIDNYADEFVWHLTPFGGLDVMHLVRKAHELNVSPRELADILYEKAEEFDIKLFDEHFTTDLNQLFNSYIIDRADENIQEELDISIRDYDVYFFANYLDDPLQYSNEVVDILEQAIKDKGKDNIELNEYSRYILDIMKIEY